MPVTMLWKARCQASRLIEARPTLSDRCGKPTEAKAMDREVEFFQRDRNVHPPAFTPAYKTSVLRSPRLPLLSLQNSLSEVTGPMFGSHELGELDNDLISNYAKHG